MTYDAETTCPESREIKYMEAQLNTDFAIARESALKMLIINS